MRVNTFSIFRFHSCGTVFVSFATLHFGLKELDVILGDILSHLGGEGSNTTNSVHSNKENETKGTKAIIQAGKDEKSIQNLTQIIRAGIFGHNKDMWNPIHALSHCNNLMPLFEHLEGKTRIALAKETLQNICSLKKDKEMNTYLETEDDPKKTFDGPLSVNSLIYLCSILSDSVDALTIEGTVTYTIFGFGY